MRKFETEDEPLAMVADLLGKVHPPTVHMMGQALESFYKRENALELVGFMSNKHWNTAERQAAMAVVLASMLSDLPPDPGLRESYVMAFVAHLWVSTEDVDQMKRDHAAKPEARMYFLFESSERATVFVERAMDHLDGGPSDPLTARAAGPFAIVISDLCKVDQFRQDMCLVAMTLGGREVAEKIFQKRSGTMDDAARAAYIYSQTACMLAELEAMRAANIQARLSGQSGIPYGSDSFIDLPSRYGLHHNTVVEFLR